MTEPAADVTLAALAPAGRALITSGLWVNELDVQISALLAANSLNRSSLFSGVAIDAAARDVLWLPARLMVNDESVQVMMGRISDLTVAYAIGVPAQFAGAWRSDKELESLGAIDAAQYLIDPLQMHSYPSLNEQTTRLMSSVDFY